MPAFIERGEVYKTPRPHEENLPRPGDFAEIRRGHCRANAEAGLIVEVMGEPHLCFCQCADCGSELDEHHVEIYSDDPHFQKTPGPWFYPIRWLRRIDPRDQVNARLPRNRHYAPLLPTDEQLVAANPGLELTPAPVAEIAKP